MKDEFIYIQNTLFPINNNNNVFIYPEELHKSLPQKCINCIKPSMKNVASFTISQLQQLTAEYPFQLFQPLNTNLIHQLLHVPTKTITLNNGKIIKNSILSDDNYYRELNHILNDFKYKEPYFFPQIKRASDEYPNCLIPKCNTRLLLEYEDKYKIKYLVSDKQLGIAIVGKSLLENVVKKEIKSIFIEVKYPYNPQHVKYISIQFIYKHQNILNDHGKIPNKSMTILINDVFNAKNGFFQWNPLYKAHKFQQNDPDSPKIHTPKIRPVISGIQSPIAPIAKFMALACTKLIHAFQDEYKFVNITQDSFHVITIFDRYVQDTFDPTDVISIYDYTSFYTELPYEWCQNNLTKGYHILMNKYYNSKDKKYKIYANMMMMLQEGYELTSKYSIIKINDKLYIQKQGVIMGASYAPSFANLQILIHYIRNEAYNEPQIKLMLRAMDDTLLITNNKCNASKLFAKYSPSVLNFTSEDMINNKIKFLDILFIKIDDKIEYCMQIKELKTEFYVPYKSNHPYHMKINIMNHMTQRAIILCSNFILFCHTINALRIRFEKSGYPISVINKYLDTNKYEQRNALIKALDEKRNDNMRKMLDDVKINYKPIYKNKTNKFMQLPYDKMIASSKLFQIRQKFQNTMFTFKLNESIQRMIRRKEANSKLL